MGVRFPLVLAIASLLFPAASAASTAAVVEYQDRTSGAYVSYVAAPGEENDLTVEGGGSSVVLTDPGADIAPGTGCMSSGPNSVTCTSIYAFDEVRALLGNGNDDFASAGPRFDVHGGPGDDELYGGDGGGTLFGDADDDVLEAGVLAATLIGGEGDDSLLGRDGSDFLIGGPGADSMDGGGEGPYTGDMVSYDAHSEPVTIDLSAPGPAGAAGEGDTVSNVESARGGEGADTITGSDHLAKTGIGSTILGNGGNDVIRGGAGPDALAGGDGDDHISGRAGDDSVYGDGGRDTLGGGRGHDYIVGHDYGPYERDRLRCGRGRNVVLLGVTASPLLDVIGQSCRHVDSPINKLHAIQHGYEGDPVRAVRATTGCRRRCAFSASLYAQGQLQARAKRQLEAGSRTALRLPLTDPARNELSRTGKLRVRFAVDFRWGKRLQHERPRTSYYIALRTATAAR